MAAGLGFEPKRAAPKADVLPLHYPATKQSQKRIIAAGLGVEQLLLDAK